MLYYDHCNVIEFKNWLFSFVCPSKCTQEASVATGPSAQRCSLFSTHTTSHIIAQYELTILLVCDIVQMLINLWYRHKMANSGASGSSSLLATGVIAGRRVSAHQAGSTTECASLLLHSYLLDPITRIFRTSDEQNASTTPNISVPASPTTLKPPDEENIPEEKEDVSDAVADVTTETEIQSDKKHHHQQ